MLPSLLSKLTLWQRLGLVLVPILGAVTSVELYLTRQDAIDSANAAYDRSLLGALRSIDSNISTASGGLSVELPYSIFDLFELTADRKSTRLNSSHLVISYAVFCLKKKNNNLRSSYARVQ